MFCHISILIFLLSGIPGAPRTDLVPFVRYPLRGPMPPSAGVYEVRQVEASDPEALVLLGASPKLTSLYHDVFAVQEKGQAKQAHLGSTLLEAVKGEPERLLVRWAQIEPAYGVAVAWTLLQEHLQRFGQPPPLSHLHPSAR